MNKLGLIGGGQLAMLIASTANKYSIDVECLDPNPNCSAHKDSKNIIVAKFNNKESLVQLFKNNDFISYEFENIDLFILKNVNHENYNKCIQGHLPLFFTNNRLREKLNLINCRIKTNRFYLLNNYEDAVNYLEIFNQPTIAKTLMLGYDGKGQVQLDNKFDLTNLAILKDILSKQECILEQKIDFKFELSLTGVYTRSHQFHFLPLNYNVHQHGILHTAKPYKNFFLQKQAEFIFQKLAKGIGKPSIYTIEFFYTKKNKLLVNEVAPRVHNSSHHGIDNYNISQYDLFLSLFFDIPLPKFKILHNNVLVNVLGQHYNKVKESLHKYPSVRFYDYFKKEIKLNRKMGHLIIDPKQTNILDFFQRLCTINAK